MESVLIESLHKGLIPSYEEVYKQYFKALLCYAISLVNDEYLAEEMVQNVFLKIWEKKNQIDIQTSLKAYLYKAVYFECLNFLKHQKVKQQYHAHASYVMKNEHAPSATDQIQHKTLENNFRKALDELPDQCSLVFKLSRFESLRYKDIAERLGISEKTVESHMGKALKLLRLKLAEFISLFLILFTYLKNWKL